MKVDHKTSVGAHGLENVKAGKLSSKNGTGKPGLTKGSEAASGSSKIDLSDRAQLMQKAKEIASKDSIDEAKVARLQKMIDEGKYKTDSKAIADRLVDEHMSFPE